MSEPSTSIAYAELRSEIGQYYGWGRDSAAWAVENRSTIIGSRLASGVRQVITPPILPGERVAHEWSWLKPVLTFTTTAPYDTGTIAATSGVVTLTTGTWPSTAAAGELVVDGVSYSINTRDSGTQVTLDDLTVTITAGTEYQIIFPFVTMPDDFGGILGPLTYRAGSSTQTPPLQMLGEWSLRQMRQAGDTTGAPRQFAVRTQPATTTAGQRLTTGSTVGQRWELMFWPIPDAAYELSARTHVSVNVVNGTHTYPPGGPALAELFLTSCLAAAEQGIAEQRGVHWQSFMSNLQAAVAYDRQSLVTEFGEIDRDRSDCPAFELHNDPRLLVTYEGY